MGTFSVIRPSLTLKAVRAIFAAALLSVLLVVGADEAGAATSSGTLAIKRQGAVNYGEVAGNVAPAGGTSAYYVRIRNTGTEVDQFRVTAQSDDTFAVTRALTLGRTDVTAAAFTPQGYLTPALAPGQELRLTLTLLVADNANHDAINHAFTDFQLRSDADAAQLDRAISQTALESTSGTTAWDGFVRAGFGRFTGGSTQGEVVGDALKTRQSMSFTVRLVNNSPAPSVVGLRTLSSSDSCLADWPYTVKDGFSDVTAAAKAGTYARTLEPERHRDLKIRMTSAGGGPACLSQIAVAVLKGQGGTTNVLDRIYISAARP